MKIRKYILRFKISNLIVFGTQLKDILIAFLQTIHFFDLEFSCLILVLCNASNLIKYLLDQQFSNNF